MPYLGNDLKVAFQSYQVIDDISSSFNGVTTSFPLRVNSVTPSPFPINPQQCLIIVGGVPQKPDLTGVDGFTLSGSNIVLSSAPAAGEKFWGVVLAGADYVNVGANFPSGSALAPSITFDSDNDTGVYSSGANQLSFTTGGTERLRLDSAGQIESVSLGSASAPSWSYTSDPNTGTFSPGSDTWAITTGSTERARIDSSGRLLVGTTNALGNFVFAASNSSNIDVVVANKADYVGGTNQEARLVLGKEESGNAVPMGVISGRPNDATSSVAGILTFSTRNSGALAERMRITNGGVVLVNDTELRDLTGQSFQVSGYSVFYQTNSGITASVFTHTGSSTQTVALFRQGSPANIVGSITVTGGTTTAYNTSSDYRLKENVVPLTGAIDRLNQLQVHRFNFIANPGKTVDGFIAHEAQAVVPECVTGEKDAVDDEGNPIYQGIDQSKLVPLLTAALQEAIAEIESLKGRLTAAGI
jgi:hypothetical protein